MQFLLQRKKVVVYFRFKSSMPLRQKKKNYFFVHENVTALAIIYLCVDHVMCWNYHRILNLCFLFNFSAGKKIWPNYPFWGTFKLFWCPNSKEMNLQSSISPFVLLSDLIFFFSWKIQNSTTISIFDANFNATNMTWSVHS